MKKFRLNNAGAQLAENIGRLFYAPLTHSLAAVAAGSSTATFTRATTATVVGYGPAAVSGDPKTVLTVASGEARFQGARRVSEGVWSPLFADGTPIPNSQLDGYLSEGQRTNVCPYSEEFGSWTTPAAPTAATITPNYATSPDGTQNAARLQFTGVTNHPAFVTGTISLANGAKVTNSIHIKWESGSLKYNIQIFTAGAANQDGYGFLTFNNDGTIASFVATGTVPPGSLGYELIGDGWYRVFVTQTNATGGTQTADRLSVGRGEAATGSVLIWGGQIEQADFVSSYIKTTGTSSATRNADVLTYPSSGNVLQGVGSLAMQYSENVAGAGGAIVSLNTGAFFARLQTSSILDSYDLNAAQTLVNAARTSGTVYNFAMRWGGVLQRGAQGGTLGTEQVFDGAFDTDASIGVGGNTVGTSQTFGTVKNLRIFNRALTDAELQGLTR